jgi:hypothetical protein
MEENKIIHQDRNFKIVRLPTKENNKYKYRIEMTTGLVSKTYEEYCASDSEAFKISWLRLKDLQRKEP